MTKNQASNAPFNTSVNNKNTNKPMKEETVKKAPKFGFTLNDFKPFGSLLTLIIILIMGGNLIQLNREMDNLAKEQFALEKQIVQKDLTIKDLEFHSDSLSGEVMDLKAIKVILEDENLILSDNVASLEQQLSKTTDIANKYANEATVAAHKLKMVRRQLNDLVVATDQLRGQLAAHDLNKQWVENVQQSFGRKTVAIDGMQITIDLEMKADGTIGIRPVEAIKIFQQTASFSE